MKIFAIADLHLSFDERVSKPMDVFGNAWNNHAQRTKDNWIRQISDQDLVIIPGDISWGLKIEEAMADLEWVHELPGSKVLTKGNHDLWWSSVGRLNTLYDDMYFLQNKGYRVGDTDVFICGTRGWNCPGTDGFDEHDMKVYKRELIRLEFSLEDAVRQGAKDIIVSLHYPPMIDRFRQSGFTQLMETYPVSRCIYGHLHGSMNFKRGFEGVQNEIDYRLVSLDRLECNPRFLMEV